MSPVEKDAINTSVSHLLSTALKVGNTGARSAEEARVICLQYDVAKESFQLLLNAMTKESPRENRRTTK